ncbi:MAG: hypothetical protein QW083_04495 [Methanomassiliicoccales archaeon]
MRGAIPPVILILMMGGPASITRFMKEKKIAETTASEPYANASTQESSYHKSIRVEELYKATIEGRTMKISTAAMNDAMKTVTADT